MSESHVPTYDSTRRLLSNDRLSTFFKEFRWLHRLLKESTFRNAEWRVTSIRIKRVDEILVNRQPESIFDTDGPFGEMRYERLYLLDSNGEVLGRAQEPCTLVTVGPRWYCPFSFRRLAPIKNETLSQVRARIGSKGDRAHFAVSVMPTRSTDKADTERDMLAVDVTIYKMWPS